MPVIEETPIPKTQGQQIVLVEQEKVVGTCSTFGCVYFFLDVGPLLVKNCLIAATGVKMGGL